MLQVQPQGAAAHANYFRATRVGVLQRQGQVGTLVNACGPTRGAAGAGIGSGPAKKLPEEV